MKHAIKLAICATIVAFCLSTNSFSQFIQVPGSGNQYFRTIPQVSGVGVGNAFTLANPPQAAFHINTNQLFFPAAFNTGEVFRTDCPAGNKQNKKLS